MEDKEKLSPEAQKELDDACKRLLETLGGWTDFAQEMAEILKDKLSSFDLIPTKVFSDEIRKAFEPIEKTLAEWDGVYKALKTHFDALIAEDPDNALLPVGACTLRAVLRAESAGEVLPEVVVEYLKKYLTSVDGIHWDGTQSVTDFVAQRRARMEKQEESTEPVEQANLSIVPPMNEIGIAISKAFRSERAIGLYGLDFLRVGRQTIGDDLKIDVSITGLDGKPIDIDGVCMGVERAIGNIIDASGGKSALPLRLTPAQIYRAYAALPNDAKVTPQQAAIVHYAMEKMIFAPASINFKAQLKQHKNIHRQSDYDYDSEESGRLKGPLINGRILENVSHNGIFLPVVYEIYAAPMFYEYSHIIGQIVTTPKFYLSGEEKGPIKERTEPDALECAATVSLNEWILTRIKREQHKKATRKKTDRNKPYVKIIKFSELAEDTGIDLSTDRRRRTIRKNTEQYLQFMQRQKEIVCYEIVKSVNKIIGYKVTF